MALGHQLLARVAATVDRAFVAGMEQRNRRVRARAEVMSHEERLLRLAHIAASYGEPELIERPDAFFLPQPPISPRLERVRSLPDGEVLQASWPSVAEPFLVAVRDSYLSHVENRWAYARLYLAHAPRPAVVLLHGYMAGQWSVEERAWPIAWLRRLGLDVAIAVLPFHAVRGGGGAPDWPGADPRVTNEGFRQAIADLRGLIGYLRDRGAPSVGVMGMSLGGYTTALLATLERDLAFAVPLIPLASLADFARDRGRLGKGATADEQHRALEYANRVVSPLSRPSLVPPHRVLVVGAEEDRITPMAHALRLSRHLGAPLLRLHGGHLLQLWRREAFREIRTMWKRAGII